MNARARFELPPTAGLPLRFGDLVRQPPRSLAAGLEHHFGIPDLIFACSGTAALVTALTALHRLASERNTVVLPAYSCPLVVLAVALVPGLRVVLCDLIPDGIDMDPQRLAEIVDGETLAIVPTHHGGRVADVETACTLARRCGAFIIEDAAQALGARDRGQSVGVRGDVGFFSLAAGKGLTMYEGGILFSRDPAIAKKLRDSARTLLKPNLLWNMRRSIELLGYAAFYRPERLWWVYGRSLRNALQAGDPVKAVGDDFTLADVPLHAPNRWRLKVAANALERLLPYLEEGRVRALRRKEALQRLPGVRVIEDKTGNEGVWPFLMVLLPTKEQRDRVLDRLWTKGLGVSRLFIHALPDYPALAPFLMDGALCPNARAFAGRMLSVSNTHWMEEETFRRIVRTIGESL